MARCAKSSYLCGRKYITLMTKDQSLRHEGEHLLDDIKNLGQELLDEANAPALIPSIYTRRSIRKFVDTPLTGDEVQVLLEAGLRAPSSKNKHRPSSSSLKTARRWTA